MFRVITHLVLPFLEGMSLETAMENSRIFLMDYSVMEKVDVDSERVVSMCYKIFTTCQFILPAIWQVAGRYFEPWLFYLQRADNPTFPR